MTNLKILSMNLERDFILRKKDIKKRELLKEAIKENDYDIILMQRGDLRLNNKRLGYKEIKKENSLVTLYKDKFPGFTLEDDLGFDIASNLVIYYHNLPVSIINVNCKNKESFYNIRSFSTVTKMCEKYSDPTSPHYVRKRIVTGVFPKDVNIKEFCDMFDLYDVSKREVSRDRTNYFFISRDFECERVIEEKDRTEVILKKVLK